MKRIKQLVIDILKNDANMSGLINGVYPASADVSPENMPCIVVLDVGGSTRTNPRNSRDILLQFSIFSKTNQTEVETIYERLLIVINFINGKTADGTNYWWMREESQADVLESGDRRIWHKAVTFVGWAR